MDKIIGFLTELHSDVDFETCDTLVDDGILDSMDIVSLVTDIFNEFDVRIPADRIVPEKDGDCLFAMASCRCAS